MTLDTMAERIGGVLIGCAILVAALAGSWRWFSRSFYHGFMVCAGMFLSIDIILLHWVFRLHRITSGPEADVLEPILVLIGIGFVAYGIAKERRSTPS
jgi:hypothetical protein